ncbi:helix-turn-helix domain-containing protein [Halanaerobium salsuginis]|jgi:transcriptional regulator with XRE-family HTH domain|uniref:DNA-binding transcriptional regulator, XRE-family HTH domain n=1 Tax=Halanaerobium salsuginis TaxID=29563 RepID=A0A1I4MYF9_9FIRM|nr:helix-turn-helix transcriptional regulator [Halanaerobium salsuginis]SFM08010.1 DNA-binding transcriptional regulator, XRE-family HTH domain [Halanaerobium salsuginis]
MSFAKNLKEVRQNNGLTQKKLAELIGVKRSTIAGYESKNQEPSYQILLKIARALNCSVDSLLAADYNEYRISESNISQEILNNEELKLLFDKLRELEKAEINFYRRLVDFIENEKGKF